MIVLIVLYGLQASECQDQQSNSNYVQYVHNPLHFQLRHQALIKIEQRSFATARNYGEPVAKRVSTFRRYRFVNFVPNKP